MSTLNRSQYCVFYPDQEGELYIRENIGVDDLGKIFKNAESYQMEKDVLAFNMKGICQLSDIANHRENTYSLILIKQGHLQVFENVNSEIQDLIKDADRYYIVDDVFIISDAALHQLIS